LSFGGLMDSVFGQFGEFLIGLFLFFQSSAQKGFDILSPPLSLFIQ